MTTTLNAREKITSFRLAVPGMRRYLTKTVYSMPAFERPGIGTMCVDRTGQMYYDPEFIDRLTPEQGGYCLIHETGHLLLRHHEQLRPILGDNPPEWLREAANIAADVALEQVLLRGGLEKHRPFQVHTYEQHNLPPRKTMVEYLMILIERHKAGSPPPPPPQYARGSPSPASRARCRH